MKKILLAEFKHETNRISPTVTNEDVFRQRNYLFGNEIVERFTGTHNEIGGMIEVLEACPDVEFVPVVALNASPGGPVTKSVYDTVVSELLKAIDANPDIDGILLSLHGAMVAENTDDGEGTLLEILRGKVGPDMPVIASLDLHCNVTKKMMDHATALFTYDYYPHTDTYETGIRAAECMVETLRGNIRPVMRWRKLDLIPPYIQTSEPAVEPFLKKIQALRGKGGIINASISYGFFISDIYELGAAVLVTTDGDPELAQKTADEIGDELWANRDRIVCEYDDLDESISEVLAAKDGPYVFADAEDNPGAGSFGNTTHILKRLIERNATEGAVVFLYDPEGAEEAAAAGVGATVDMKVGGKEYPEVTGGPVPVKAYVRAITDGRYVTKDYCPGTKTTTGKTAVLEVNGMEIVLNSFRNQNWDLEQLRKCGITPEDKKLIVVKSTIHFRASYSKIAKKIFVIEVPAFSPQDPAKAPLTHVRRPIYPLDKDM